MSGVYMSSPRCVFAGFCSNQLLRIIFQLYKPIMVHAYVRQQYKHFHQIFAAYAQPAALDFDFVKKC